MFGRKTKEIKYNTKEYTDLFISILMMKIIINITRIYTMRLEKLMKIELKKSR
jgi:hypothetical protein